MKPSQGREKTGTELTNVKKEEKKNNKTRN